MTHGLATTRFQALDSTGLVTLDALLVLASDPRYSTATKRATLQHALAVAQSEGFNMRAEAIRRLLDKV